jgi:hypothetical protein
MGEWASTVAHSEVKTDAEVPEGAEVGGRVCRVPGMGEVHECLTAYDELNKTFSYEIQGLPFIVMAASNNWSVATIDGDRSRVSMEIFARVLPVIGWLMIIPVKLQLNKMTQVLLEDLKHFVETGDVHPRKKALEA